MDRLIEPVYYDRGIDIYKGGLNIAISNSLFWFGNFFWDKALYSELLVRFMIMCRIKEIDSIRLFYETANSLYLSVKAEEKTLILPLLQSRNQIGEILTVIDKFSLDVTLSLFFVLIDLWHRKTGKKLEVIFDTSKQITHYQRYIDFMKQNYHEPQEIGYGSRKLIFPAQIESVSQVDSKDIAAIQISDLIASTVSFMYSNKNEKQNPFVSQIQKSRLLNLSNSHTIWPNKGVTPDDLDMSDFSGTNILDYLVGVMKASQSTSDSKS